MNKSHAIIYLTCLIGEADGSWSEQEIKTALMSGSLMNDVKNAPDWADKISSGELNEDSAIYILNQESKEVQMECLINCLLTACADGIFDNAEVQIISRIMANLNKGISVEELMAVFKARFVR